MNQMNHQNNGTSNLRQLTSNPGPILPKPTLWFQLSWGDLIITPSIMVMLKYPLKRFPVDSNSESVPDPYTTTIKSVDDDTMDHLM